MRFYNSEMHNYFIETKNINFETRNKTKEALIVHFLSKMTIFERPLESI